MPQYCCLGLFPLRVISCTKLSMSFQATLQRIHRSFLSRAGKNGQQFSSPSLLCCRPVLLCFLLFKCSLVNLHVFFSALSVRNLLGFAFADNFCGHAAELLLRPRHTCLYLKLSVRVHVPFQMLTKLNGKIGSFHCFSHH